MSLGRGRLTLSLEAGGLPPSTPCPGKHGGTLTTFFLGPWWAVGVAGTFS